MSPSSDVGVEDCSREMDDRRPPERLEECRQQQHQQRRAMTVIVIAAPTAMPAMALEEGK